MGNNPSKKDRRKSVASTSPSSPATSTTSITSSSTNDKPRAVTPTPSHTPAPPTPTPTPSSSSNTPPNKTPEQMRPSKSKPAPDAAAASANSKKVDELFDKYRDPADQTSIGPEGVYHLCNDLGVDPEDVSILILAFYMDAQKMGYFKREEWATGLQKIGVDSIGKLKAHLPTLKKDLDDPVKFKDIYRFSFYFAKEKDQKILDLGTSEAMLRLVLLPLFPTIVDGFCAFLKEQTTYKSLNLDQWLSLLEFCRTIKPDLSNYDENAAWPVLLDEFVGWSRDQKGG